MKSRIEVITSKDEDNVARKTRTNKTEEDKYSVVVGRHKNKQRTLSRIVLQVKRRRIALQVKEEEE